MNKLFLTLFHSASGLPFVIAIPLMVIFATLYFFTHAFWALIGIGILACVLIGVKLGITVKGVDDTFIFSAALNTLFNELKIDDDRASEILQRVMISFNSGNQQNSGDDTE